MRQHPRNGWVHSSEFLRAATTIHKYATTVHTHWLGVPGCKYLSLRVDQRTGDFIVRDSEDHIVEAETLYATFPELRD